MTTINEAVQESLNNLGDRTRAAVVEHYAEKEATKRANALIKGLDILGDLEREREKLSRPDNVSYDLEGNKVSESYSKSQIDSRNKVQSRIDKLVKAIDKADNEAEFNELYNLTK